MSLRYNFLKTFVLGVFIEFCSAILLICYGLFDFIFIYLFISVFRYCRMIRNVIKII